MKAMIPRFGVLLISLALVGCGLELWSPLNKLSTSSGAGGLQYSWPVDMALPLGTISLSLDDPDVARSVFGDLSVMPGHDERLQLLPASQTLDPIRFAENLVITQSQVIDLPPQRLPAAPPALVDIPFQAIRLSANTVFGDMDPGQIIPVNLRYHVDSPLDFPAVAPSFTEARVGTPKAGTSAGHFEFTLDNRSGVRLSPTVRLYAKQDGVTREVGRTPVAVPLDPGESGKVTLPLHPGSTLTRELSLGFDFFIPGGQQVMAPVSELALSNIRLVPTLISHMRVPIATTSIEIAPMPLELGLDNPDFEMSSVLSLEVDAGALELTLHNRFPVATTLDLEFPEFYRAGQSTPLSSRHDLKAGETRTFEIPLAGVVIRPQNGRLSVRALATTKDTGPAGALMALDESQTVSGQVVLRAPTRFRAVEVPVTRDIALPASTLPLQVPSLLSDQGVSLQDVVMWLHLENDSLLSGDLALDVQATIPGRGNMPLTDKSGGPIRLPIAPNQLNALRLTSQNSNLLDILNAMPTALTVQGKVKIDTQGRPIRLSGSDQLEGRLGVEIPLSLMFAPFGGNAEKPAIEVRPATPLTFTSENRDHLNRVERAVLKLNVDNGWNVPLDLDLLFSATSDPFSDAEAFVRTISLGNPSSGFRLNNEVTLEGESLKRFREASMLGMRIRSSGSLEPVSIFRGSRFWVNLGIEFKALLSSSQEVP